MQNPLIVIESRELSPGEVAETVNARDLWQFVGSKRDFPTWIRDRFEKYGFVEGSDYLIHKSGDQVPHQGGVRNVTITDYFLTIAVAKELAMVENNDKGREVRRYFIDCERLAKAKAAVPSETDIINSLNDPALIRSVLLNYVEKVIALESTVKEQAPKVAALDRICTFSEGSMCVTDAAKALQIKPSLLFLWLQEHDWIYRRIGSSWIAYQPRLKQGLLEHKVTTVKRKDDTDKIVEQVRVTAKGLSYLADVFSRPVMQLE